MCITPSACAQRCVLPLFLSIFSYLCATSTPTIIVRVNRAQYNREKEILERKDTTFVLVYADQAKNVSNKLPESSGPMSCIQNISSPSARVYSTYLEFYHKIQIQEVEKMHRTGARWTSRKYK